MSTDIENLFKDKVLGHPAGLFILFFTEMWERFSYYGMRALLVLFLVSAAGLGGWDWPRSNALALYGTYTSMVYLTPILGGYLADKYLGYRNAVIIGAIIMTLGHASMAMEFDSIFLYIGIGLLIIGNGLFKPNMTSIISHMYKNHEEKKDGAYTIFYMGVNAGAFLGILLCGYVGETKGWGYGFGLAGIFMFLGMLQFYFAQNIFGEIGKKVEKEQSKHPKLEFEGDALNPFTKLDLIMVAFSSIAGLIWIINDPLTVIGGRNILKFGDYDASTFVILSAVIVFVLLLISRIIRYHVITRDRMIAIVIFAIFTVIFWASFEQAGGSMTIFAKDYTNRILSGSSATLFNVINIIITVVPILIITWVLFLLFKLTFKHFALSNIFLGTSFVIIWLIVGWMINRNLHSNAYVINYQKEAHITKNDNDEEITNYTFVTEGATISNQVKTDSLTIRQPLDLANKTKIFLIDVDKRGTLKYLSDENAQTMPANLKIIGEVVRKKGKEVEIPASWFGILNSLFIILFAPLFSKWWESKYNPSAAAKYGLGLILLGIGFGVLAYGSTIIPPGAKTATVSIMFLVVAYLFHTLGELCLSPVALSYISKLVPGRMIALMFGVWYIAIAIGNKTAGKMGGAIDQIQETHSMTYFFMIFTIVPIALGVLGILAGPLIKKLMHGVK